MTAALPGLPAHPLLPLALTLPPGPAGAPGGFVRLGWLAAPADRAAGQRTAQRLSVRQALAAVLADPAVQPPPPAPRRAAAHSWLAWSYQDHLPCPGALLAWSTLPLGLDIQAGGLIPPDERAALARDMLGDHSDRSPNMDTRLTSDASFTRAWVAMEACDKALRRGLRQASAQALRERARCQILALDDTLLQRLGLPAQALQLRPLHAALAWCQPGDIPHDAWG